jgi:hypothetical protein
MFEAAILEQCSYLFVGGVFVFYELIFRVPKGTPTKKKALMLSGDIMRDITPDRVNCEDFLDNRLKNTIIEDDSKIIFGGSIKRWGLKDETVIYIAQAENTYSAIDFCKLVMDMVL